MYMQGLSWHSVNKTVSYDINYVKEIVWWLPC